MSVASSSEGEDTIIYVMYIFVFAIFLAIAIFLVLQGRQLDNHVPEQFRDDRDLYGIMNHCGMPNLDLIDLWLSCYDGGSSARAYKATITFEGKEFTAKTTFWDDEVRAGRVFKPKDISVLVGSKIEKASVVWEVQGASIIG